MESARSGSTERAISGRSIPHPQQPPERLFPGEIPPKVIHPAARFHPVTLVVDVDLRIPITTRLAPVHNQPIDGISAAPPLEPLGNMALKFDLDGLI